MPRLLRLTALFAVALSCACATHRTSGPRPNRDILTHDEMAANHFITVYDAVAALRSNWLNIRPNTLTASQEDVVIYFDVTRLGAPAELRNIRVSDVDHVQHFDAVAATQRYGVGHSQGVILVSAHSLDGSH